ncbi:hybrid sensor histidine kinase/response regulator [Actomonas aquatica]|uniref:histidine kinase n=1 Tax=Actomonas aquatica TaxID=2866162 RepID=A0ABZ1CF22_9BACT|nr:response regulator [Opitutus sp. WL0086]WRQ89960.1 response regulator [Opitutus sp. WL0086]
MNSPSATAPPSPLRVLIVDDAPEDRVEFRRLLCRGQESQWAVEEVPDAERALERLEDGLPDCVLMDIDLIRMDGRELLNRIIERHGHHACGLVMLTASTNTSVAVDLLKSGAHDFLLKSRITAPQLRRAVRHAVEKASIRREISRSRQELQRKHDDLEEAVGNYERETAQRERAEEALRRSESRFRNLADNISQLAWMTDETGYIFWYNKRWFDYTGTTLDGMRGWGWRSVHHPDHIERVVSKFKECLARGSEWEDTFPLRGKDGSYRWFLSRAIPIHDPHGKVLGWFGTNTDITRQLETEDALKSARDQALAASRAKDDFLAALSHELRTPLNPALLTASARASDESLPAEVRADFESIRDSVALEARLIDDLLDLTRITRGKLKIDRQDIDLHTVLQDALRIVRSEFADKGVTWQLDLTDASLPLRGDAVRLRQVIWNVLKNAAKFSPDQGTIHVSLQIVEPAAPETGPQVQLIITDEGIGLTPTEVTSVFDAFAQGEHVSSSSHRFGGLGLGLAISRTLVEMHDGSISASSEGRDRGASFTIRLPLVPATEPPMPVSPTASPAPSATPAAPTEAAPSPTRPCRMLLVEDHAPTRATMGRLLRQRGLEIIAVGTYAEALQVEQHGHIDALLSDIGLPDGDGSSLLPELRQHWPDLVGIALSGYGMEEDIKRSERNGFLLHLTKPIEIDQLDRALRRLKEHLGCDSAPSA